MSQFADEAKVTDAWFLPHFPARNDRPYEIAMFRAWKKYMRYEGNHGGGWSSEIANILSQIPRALNERGSRVAITFAIWLMTPNGKVFLDTLFRDQKELKGVSFGFRYDDYGIAIQSWAHQNRLSTYTINTLHRLLLDEQGLVVYPDSPHPTLEDSRVVEMLCCFFVCDAGKDLLRRVYKNASRKTDRFTVRRLPFAIHG